MDSDTEDQENKRPNVSAALSSKQPTKTIPIEPKIREIPKAKSAIVNDNDGFGGDGDDDLFNFDEVEQMTATNKATASNKVANSTVLTQGNILFM